MGIRERLANREHIRAIKLREVKKQLNKMQKCLNEAKELHLPTVPFMEAALILITNLTKAELP